MNNTQNLANRIKDVLIQMAIDDKLPMDMTTLKTREFEKILKPLVEQLETCREDADMALSGDWDFRGGEAEESFQCTIENIDEVFNNLKPKQ